MSVFESLSDYIKRANRINDLCRNTITVEKEIMDSYLPIKASSYKDKLHKLAVIIKVTEEQWVDPRLHWIDFMKNVSFSNLSNSPDKIATILCIEARFVMDHPLSPILQPEIFEDETWRKCYYDLAWMSTHRKKYDSLCARLQSIKAELEELESKVVRMHRPRYRPYQLTYAVFVCEYAG
jgi:hypothetical protein